MDTKEMAYYSNPGGTLEKFLLNNLKPLISRNEELYISKEANKENALASEGKSCRPQKINMHVTTSQYDIHVYSISGQNSHLHTQNVFLQGIINYSTEKSIYWNKQHFCMIGKSCVFPTDPLFYTGKITINDGRPLYGTWRTLYMNKNLINKAFVRSCW